MELIIIHHSRLHNRSGYNLYEYAEGLFTYDVQHLGGREDFVSPSYKWNWMKMNLDPLKKISVYAPDERYKWMTPNGFFIYKIILDIIQ